MSEMEALIQQQARLLEEINKRQNAHVKDGLALATTADVD